MNTHEILSIVEKIKKGQFVRIKYATEVKLPAKFKLNTLLKISETTVRLGVDYANLTSTHEKYANEPDREYKLQWGQWSHFPYIIEHNGQDYLRCTTVENSNTTTQYKYNGQDVQPIDIAHLLKEKTNGEKPSVFTVNVSKIISLGQSS